MKNVLRFILVAILVFSGINAVLAETITIEVDSLQYSILSQYAQENNLTVEEYSGNIVKGWANSHIEGYYIEQLRQTKKEDLEFKYGKIKIKERSKI